MLFRLMYDDHLAQAAYLIGCQRTGEAIVFDPERDIDRLLSLARKEGVRITAVAETHIHADFLSGARELAEATGARLYLSDEGGPDWKYQWLHAKSGGGAYDHRLLKHNDTFKVGNIEFRALHTPGHTPEHLCFLVTDLGSGATEPMGLISGDFIFVGDLGRPDLLETAAGQVGAKEPAARDLFKSVQRFLELPDFLQVWPAHGAGSACGKALGAVPQSTVGYEKRFNPSIRAAASGQAAFVDFILSGQPDPPLYFARMKRLNKLGPPVLGDLPRPRALAASELAALSTRSEAIIDTRTWKEFIAGHIPGSLYIPLDNSFNTLAGSYILDDSLPITLIIDPARLDTAIRDLIRIGLDHIASYAAPSVFAEFARTARGLAVGKELDVQTAAPRARNGEFFLLDVRTPAEFAAGHLPGAININHTQLAAHISRLPRDKPMLVNCRSGGRSARACALLQQAGYNAINLGGGFMAWEQAGLPTER